MKRTLIITLLFSFTLIILLGCTAEASITNKDLLDMVDTYRQEPNKTIEQYSGKPIEINGKIVVIDTPNRIKARVNEIDLEFVCNNLESNNHSTSLNLDFINRLQDPLQPVEEGDSVTFQSQEWNLDDANTDMLNTKTVQIYKCMHTKHNTEDNDSVKTTSVVHNKDFITDEEIKSDPDLTNINAKSTVGKYSHRPVLIEEAKVNYIWINTIDATVGNKNIKCQSQEWDLDTITKLGVSHIIQIKGKYESSEKHRLVVSDCEPTLVKKESKPMTSEEISKSIKENSYKLGRSIRNDELMEVMELSRKHAYAAQSFQQRLGREFYIIAKATAISPNRIVIEHKEAGRTIYVSCDDDVPDLEVGNHVRFRSRNFIPNEDKGIDLQKCTATADRTADIREKQEEKKEK